MSFSFCRVRDCFLRLLKRTFPADVPAFREKGSPVFRLILSSLKSWRRFLHGWIFRQAFRMHKKGFNDAIKFGTIFWLSKLRLTSGLKIRHIPTFHERQQNRLPILRSLSLKERAAQACYLTHFPAPSGSLPSETGP